MSLDVYLRHDGERVYDANITHNLNTMADHAGIYKHLWRPEEIDISTAGELVEPLRAGLAQLVERPTHFRQYDAENGWGRYEDLVVFASEYLEACIAYPDASIEISR